MVLLQQMLAFFIFIIIGYSIRKKGILDQKGASSISWIVLNLANPAMIISGALGDGDRMSVPELLQTLLTAVLLYAAMLLLSLVVPRLMGVKKTLAGTYRNMLIFSNTGFMGYPLLLAISGSRAVLFASIFVIIHNILVYTYGIWNFRRESALAGETVADEKFSLKRIFNVGVVSGLLALFLNFARIPLPDFAHTTLSGLANMTGTLSMMNLGCFMAQIDLMQIVKDKQLLVFSVLRMFVLPFAVIMVMKQLIHHELILLVSAVVVATPVATMVALLSNTYKKDNSEAVRGVALTTLISVISIPVVFALAGM